MWMLYVIEDYVTEGEVSYRKMVSQEEDDDTLEEMQKKGLGYMAENIDRVDIVQKYCYHRNK
jgi:hypothetical protein